MPATERTFQPDTSEVARARRFVAEALSQHPSPAVVDDAVLLTSELVANALLHTRSAATVRVERHGDVVRVSICDGSPVQPVRKRYGAEATTGRGLLLVEQLASAWGVEPESGGKAVWFELGRYDRAGADSSAGRAALADEPGDDPDLDAIAAAFGEPPGSAGDPMRNRLVSR